MSTIQQRLRVRFILQNMDITSKHNLMKLLPKEAKIPDVYTHSYPSALLRVLQKDYSYCILGCIAEDLVNMTESEITIKNLILTIKKYQPAISEESLDKVRKSKTTQPFLEHIIETRKKVEEVARGDLQGETVVSFECVEGHPDMRTKEQLFEIKLTGILKKHWTMFMLQLFSYASIAEDGVKDIYLVLPLQETVWHFQVKEWKNRKEFRELLNEISKKIQGASIIDSILASTIKVQYTIGTHITKNKVLVDTFRPLNPKLPYQLFLGASTNTNMNISDEELVTAGEYISEKGLSVYIHSQYIINLCNDDEDEWNTKLLSKNLQYANVLGCKGVVVHVGKSTKRSVANALEIMRKNILKVLNDATISCPLLLETPAGQGTEVLTNQTEFIKFVEDFDDKRFRICVDTCHVFASGYDPLPYIENVSKTSELLKLVHYNDSETPCGSCVDRHANIGKGYIGIKAMESVAKKCFDLGIDMVVE